MKIIVVLLFISFNLFAANTALTLQSGVDYRMNTAQLGFSYYLEDHKALEFKIGYGEDKSEEEFQKQFNLSLGYKIKSKTGTFYYLPEIAFVKFEERQEDEPFSNFLDLQEDYNGLSFMMKIGNEWIIEEHFILACDWVGLGLGLKFNESSDEAASDAPLHYTLLNFKIGYKF